MAKCRISFDHFTKEQVEELSSQLAALSKKDTDFPDAEELDGSERLAIVQSGENVLATMDDVSDIVAEKVEPVIMTSENIVNALGYTPYEKPDNGIPKSDLASDVRTSLDKADSAYQLPNSGIPSTDLSDSVRSSLDKADTALQAETDPTVSSWAKQPTKPSYDYSEIDNTPDLSNFITNTVDNLVNYYKKSETYNKTEVNNLISAIQGFTYLLVDSLPTASADTMHKIYLVPSADPRAQNIKDEYITIDNGDTAVERYTWECIGSTAIDLSGYVTTNELNSALSLYTTTTDLMVLLASKQDKLISGTNIKTINGASVLGPGDLSIEANTIHRELTQAEYDALSDAEKNNGTLYFITDADVGSDATFATGEKVKNVSISDKVVSGSNAIVTGGAVQESIDAYEPDAISNQEIDDIIYN